MKQNGIFGVRDVEAVEIDDASQTLRDEVVRALIVDAAEDAAGLRRIRETLNLALVLEQLEATELPTALTEHADPARDLLPADNLLRKVHPHGVALGIGIEVVLIRRRDFVAVVK